MSKKLKILHYLTIPADPIGPAAVNSAIDKGAQVIVLQVAATGAIPNDEACDYIPIIRKAMQRGIPIFLLRGVFHAAGEKMSERYGRVPPTHYGPEFDAIKEGAIPLERADASLTVEIIKLIQKVYAREQNITAVIKALCEHYNVPAFNNALVKLRGRPLF